MTHVREKLTHQQNTIVQLLLMNYVLLHFKHSVLPWVLIIAHFLLCYSFLVKAVDGRPPVSLGNVSSESTPSIPSTPTYPLQPTTSNPPSTAPGPAYSEYWSIFVIYMVSAPGKVALLHWFDRSQLQYVNDLSTGVYHKKLHYTNDTQI